MLFYLNIVIILPISKNVLEDILTMKKIFCFILFYSFLSACGGLYVDDDVERPTDDREGELALPTDLTEDFSLAGFLKNCKPSISVPDNTIDIITETLNIPYKPKEVRGCLKAKLEAGQDRICKAREELERKREKARDDASRSRVDNSIYKLEQIQFKFNQNLYKLAVDLDEELVRRNNKKETSNSIGRVFNWLVDQETEAYRDIFDVESYSECNFYSKSDK